MMMSPPLWWTMGSNLLNGTPEKIGVLPITRTASAFETAAKGTVLEGIGKLVGKAAWPEKALRGAAGLSEFGEWGDWYIDRQISNMVADGDISADEGKIAMIERQGPIFDQAKARVSQEQMLQVPGMGTIQQLAQGRVKGALQSAPNMIFPASLFPGGELKLRGLKNDYDKAWDDYNQGDDDAINKFFEDHPEYEARLALYDEPEERLQKFMIGQLWDKYSSLDKPNRTLATKILGQKFKDAFLNSDTRSYDSISVEEMARWTQMLGGAVPKTEKTTPVLAEPSGQIDLYSPDISQGITTYRAARDEQFPGISAIQAAYFKLPEKSAQRKDYLRRFPQLKPYWDWNREYKADHPELQEYWNENSQSNTPQLSEQEIAQLDPVLIRQVLAYGLAGQALSSGARSLLRQLAASRGMSDEDYARLILASMVPNQ
jgi:hypothetical protein